MRCEIITCSKCSQEYAIWDDKFQSNGIPHNTICQGDDKMQLKKQDFIKAKKILEINIDAAEKNGYKLYFINNDGNSVLGKSILLGSFDHIINNVDGL